MRLGLTESLSSLVAAKFKSAKASGSLVFSPTELAIIHTSTGIPFQLRFCPALAKKPGPLRDALPKKKFDPFDNPPAALHIADVPSTNPTHLLVLNKFPIITNHFILATKSNKEQTHALEQDDLEATYACLKAWQDGAASEHARLFAFFNSGEHSGASQPHRHLQFLPVESMREDVVEVEWRLLLDLILSSRSTETEGTFYAQHPGLPVVHFASLFEGEPTGPALLAMYKTLYQRANEAVNSYISTNPDDLTLHPSDSGSSAISYNLAMTTHGMAILPRRAEGTMLQQTDRSDIGFVALNGTMLGGTLMVKHQPEWDALRKQPEMLDKVLAALGIPRERQAQRPHV